VSSHPADRRSGSDRDAVAVEVTGGNRLMLSRAALLALSTVERECTAVCASDGRTTAT